MGPMATKPELSGSARPVPEGQLTYEEFLDWCDEDTLAEWVQGRVELASPASLRHQNLGGFLFVIMKFWVRAHNLGIVIAPPFHMRLPTTRQRRP